VASLTTFFDTAHFLARCMRYRLHTEKLEIKTLMQLDIAGATALDIGANKGIYCFWMLRAVGHAGRVVAFEPQPEMAEAIRQKQARFDWTNLRVNAERCRDWLQVRARLICFFRRRRSAPRSRTA
jgi:precorrin-6B methylase 2